MSTSLSNLVDNLSEINKEECKACINGEMNKTEFIGQNLLILLDMKIIIYASNVKNAIKCG